MTSHFKELPRFDEAEFVVLDTEDTGLNWWKDKLFGFSVAVPVKGGFRSGYWDVRERPQALVQLRKELRRAKRLVFHHAKFDMHMMREAGVSVPYGFPVHDTMLRAALLNEHEHSFDLDTLGHKYVGAGKDTAIYGKLAALFGGNPTKEAQSKNLHRAPVGLVAEYACQDVETTGRLYVQQCPRIVDEELELVDSVEHRLLHVLLEMEFGGVRVDLEAAEQAIKRLAVMIEHNQRKLDKLAGFPVNVNPSQSIHRLFSPKKAANGVWVARDGTPLQRTGVGNPSFDKEALRSMRDPCAALILAGRQLRKTKETFLEGHILGHHHKGYVHTHFNQTRTDDDLGTGTGRLSSSDPALQQITKRDKEMAQVVRSCFLPDEGQIWSCRDWKQMDFRVFAHYAKEPKLLQTYAENPDADFHQMVADMTGLPRTARFAGDKANTKQINLGLVFGMGRGKLAQQMGLPFTVEMIKFKGESVERPVLMPGEEAEEVFENYHRMVPGVREILDGAKSVAGKRGYVCTMLKRRIRFPGGRFTHKAGGLIFQGTAADALKVKLCEVHEEMRADPRQEARLMLSVHDEFDSSLPKRLAKQWDARIGKIIETFDGECTPMKFRVPIRSDSGLGLNWWEASKE